MLTSGVVHKDLTLLTKGLLSLYKYTHFQLQTPLVSGGEGGGGGLIYVTMCRFVALHEMIK